jgi:hypothetical protein
MPERTVPFGRRSGEQVHGVQDDPDRVKYR